MLTATRSIKSTGRTTDLLANAATALSIAHNFGSLIPIPVVQSLIQTALAIVAVAQAVQTSERNCAELASRCAELAKLMTEQIHKREDLLDESHVVALEKLNEAFEEVKTFVQKQNKLGLLGRFAKRGSIALEVNGLTDKLDFMMQMFQTTSCLSTGLTVKETAQAIARMESGAYHDCQYHDGEQFRVIRRSDIDLVDRLLFPTCGRSGAPREFYKGRIDGKAVTVLMNRANETTTVPFNSAGSRMYEFSEYISSLKRVWHPNIPQLEGYSDTRSSGPQFLVLKGDFIPWEAYLAMLPVDEYGLHCLRTFMESYAAVQYLWRRHLWFDEQRCNLMVDIATGRVVEGVDGVLQLSPCTNDELFGIDTAHDYMVMLYQRYQSSSSSLTLEAVLSEWGDLCPDKLNWEEAEFTYTGSDEPLYLYAGVVMDYDWFRNEPSAFTFLEFLDHTIQPVLPDWPPTLHVQSDEIHSEIIPLPASKLFVLRIESPTPGTTRVCSPVYKATCDCDGNQMSQYLHRRGYDIFRNHSPDYLYDICIVYQTAFTFQAILHDKEPSEGHQPVYLHISPMQDGRVPVPWAYFSFTREPIPDGEDTLMTLAVGDHGVCDRFISNLPGVDAEVFVRASCRYSHFSGPSAGIVGALHIVCPPSKFPDAHTSAHLEEIDEFFHQS